MCIRDSIYILYMLLMKFTTNTNVLTILEQNIQNAQNIKKEQQKEKKKKKKANSSAKTESVQNGIGHTSDEGKPEQLKEITEVPKKKKQISNKKPRFTTKGMATIFFFIYLFFFVHYEKFMYVF